MLSRLHESVARIMMQMVNPFINGEWRDGGRLSKEMFIQIDDISKNDVMNVIKIRAR